MNTTLITITYNCYAKPIILLSYYINEEYKALTYKSPVNNNPEKLWHCSTLPFPRDYKLHKKLDKIANYVPSMLAPLDEFKDPDFTDYTLRAYIVDKEEDIVIELLSNAREALIQTIKAEVK
jgi:hypothetical protein